MTWMLFFAPPVFSPLIPSPLSYLPPEIEKGILTETSQRSQCTWLCQLFCRSFDSHQQQEQHVKTYTATIFSKARELLEKGVRDKALFTRAVVGNKRTKKKREKKRKRKKMERRERVNKQTSVTQSKSNSRTGGKEPLCTNAMSLQWGKSLVTVRGSWSERVNGETLFRRTVMRQALQSHLLSVVFKELFLVRHALLSLFFWCISREWLKMHSITDILPSLLLNHPSLQGTTEYNLERLWNREWILFRLKHNVLVTGTGDAWAGEDKSRPLVALRWVSLATCWISSLVTSRRISVSSVFVMTIYRRNKKNTLTLSHINDENVWS